MSSKTSNKSNEIEKDLKKLEFLGDLLEEALKIFDNVDYSDPQSVSYVNAKLCSSLKGIIVYMNKNQIIGEYFQEILSSMLEAIEIEVDFFNSIELSKWEKGGELLFLLYKRELVVQIQRLNYFAMIVNYIEDKLLGKIQEKTEEIDTLQKQGEKLKQILEKQRKEAENKIPKYVA